MSNKLRVLSLDYDGCLAHGTANDIINLNLILINFLVENNINYFKTIAFIGSNRQSKQDDDRNARQHRNGSAFVNIKTFCEENSLNAEFDPFLMSDVYNNAPHGSSFRDAINSGQNENADIPNGWLHDKSKITLLYCQLHKVASENPGVEIDFEFYDDKIDIINELHSFFSENSHMIPQTVNLKLFEYAGNYPTERNKVVGTGPFANPNYSDTVKQFANKVLSDLSLKGNLFTVDGDPANLKLIQAKKYNSNAEFKIKDYKDILIQYHHNPQPILSQFLLKIMASKELKIAAGVLAIAGLAAVSVGTLGVAGIIAAIGGSIAIITTAIGSGAFVTRAGVGAASFFASNSHRQHPDSGQSEQVPTFS